MFLLTLTVVVLAAPAPASGQEIPLLEAAGGALRDVIADVMRGEYDVRVSRTIYEPAGESADWSDSAYAAILESLGIMIPATLPRTTIQVCRPGECAYSGASATVWLARPERRGREASVPARVDVRLRPVRGIDPIRPGPLIVNVELQLQEGTWQVVDVVVRGVQAITLSPAGTSPLRADRAG